MLSKNIPKQGYIIQSTEKLSEEDGYRAFDGSPIKLSDAPESLIPDIVNRLPKETYSISDYLTYDNYGDYVRFISKTHTIGNFDYVTIGRKVYKYAAGADLNSPTKTITLEFTPVMFGIFRSRLYFFANRRLDVYDENLTRIRTVTFSVSGDPVTACELPNGRVLILYSTESKSNSVSIVYSDNDFSSHGVSGFSPSNNIDLMFSHIFPFTLGEFYKFSSYYEPLFGDPYYPLYMNSEGRLFLIGRTTIYETQQNYLNGFYYSDDYGASFTNLNLNGLLNLTSSDRPGLNSVHIGMMFVRNDYIYVICSGTQTTGVSYGWLMRIDSKTLSMNRIKYYKGISVPYPNGGVDAYCILPYKNKMLLISTTKLEIYDTGFGTRGTESLYPIAPPYLNAYMLILDLENGEFSCDDIANIAFTPLSGFIRTGDFLLLEYYYPSSNSTLVYGTMLIEYSTSHQISIHPTNDRTITIGVINFNHSEYPIGWFSATRYLLGEVGKTTTIGTNSSIKRKAAAHQLKDRLVFPWQDFSIYTSGNQPVYTKCPCCVIDTTYRALPFKENEYFKID